MELQTVSQVSKTFGISTRMLRYYEQNGLVKSLRRDDYSYRVYDGENIKRLQRIVIMRKLQIPVKQIAIILNNPDAATAIDIFKSNIGELQSEITALETIKSALEIIVAKIEEIAAVRLNLNLLTDDSILKLAQSLSLMQRNVRENRMMDELSKATESLDKLKEKYVRVVKLPPATMAHFICRLEKNNPDSPYDAYGIAKNVMGEFVKDVDLLRVKPDFRLFQNGNATDTTSEIWVTIPDDLPVPEPLTKIHHPGGLYAAYINTPEDNVEWKILEAWVESSDDYEWRAGEARFEEHHNKYNIYGLKNSDLEYWDFLLPIKEIVKPTEEHMRKLNAVEKCLVQGKRVEIDLTTMMKHGELDVSYDNGLMALTVEDDANGMATQQQLKIPLKIELRVKTNDMNMRIRYGSGILVFNWEHIRTTLLMSDIKDGTYSFHKKCGEIPVDEFVDIEWFLGRDVMAVKVNGEIRYIGDDCGYIRAFKESQEFNLSSPVTITSAFGSTITVENLCITEIP